MRLAFNRIHIAFCLLSLNKGFPQKCLTYLTVVPATGTLDRKVHCPGPFQPPPLTGTELFCGLSHLFLLPEAPLWVSSRWSSWWEEACTPSPAMCSIIHHWGTQVLLLRDSRQEVAESQAWDGYSPSPQFWHSDKNSNIN